MQADNKIVIGGNNSEQVVIRFMPDGSINTSFGHAGKIVTAFDNLLCYEYCVHASAIQANGDILFGGNLITCYHDDAQVTSFIVKNKYLYSTLAFLPNSGIHNTQTSLSPLCNNLLSWYNRKHTC